MESFLMNSAALLARSPESDSPTGAPAGVVPNYVDPPSRGFEIITTSYACLALAITFVLIRLGTRIFIIRKTDWDDYLMIIALLWSVARVIVSVEVVKHFGTGRHSWDVMPQWYNMSYRLIVINDITYFQGVMFVKLSILMLYLRLFGVNKKFRIACYSIMALVVGYLVASTLAYIFGCSPLDKTWNISIEGTCIDDVSLDFAIGGLVCAASIVREVITVETEKNYDQSWYIVPQIMWLTIEFNVGIVCGCLPAMQPFLRQIIWKNLASSAKSSYRNLLDRRSTLSSRIFHSSQSSRPSGPPKSLDSNDSYLELGDVNNRPRTAVTGGKSNSDEIDAQGNRMWLGSGDILKTSTLDVESGHSEKSLV